MNQNKLQRVANTIALATICTILAVAFTEQLNNHDLPCPLCLLQRICFIAVGLSLCMNIIDGIKTSHYGLMLLAAALGFAIALRQIMLHMTPGDPGYGHLIFGFHMYIWSAIAFTIIIGLVAVSLFFERGFTEKQQKPGRGKFALMVVFLCLILANGVSTFIECGVLVCPDNPIRYNLFGAANNSE